MKTKILYILKYVFILFLTIGIIYVSKYFLDFMEEQNDILGFQTNTEILVENIIQENQIIEPNNQKEENIPKEKQVTNRGNNSNKTKDKKIETISIKEPKTTNEKGYIKFVATAYCPCSKCCGKNTGITASGAKAKAGVTVAMPSKYKFGTKIQIKGMGTYIVQDRGGAINGNRIDIFFNTHKEALKFGRKTVYIKIL